LVPTVQSPSENETVTPQRTEPTTGTCAGIRPRRPSKLKWNLLAPSQKAWHFKQVDTMCIARRGRVTPLVCDRAWPDPLGRLRSSSSDCKSMTPMRDQIRRHGGERVVTERRG
jgi:hypothetical protein